LRIVVGDTQVGILDLDAERRETVLAIGGVAVYPSSVMYGSLQVDILPSTAEVMAVFANVKDGPERRLLRSASSIGVPAEPDIDIVYGLLGMKHEIYG
jgi:hypothetical protein